jgi:hypothetical protein
MDFTNDCWWAFIKIVVYDISCWSKPGYYPSGRSHCVIYDKNSRNLRNTSRFSLWRNIYTIRQNTYSRLVWNSHQINRNTSKIWVLINDPFISSKFHEKWSFVFFDKILWIRCSFLRWFRIYIWFYDSSVFLWNKSRNMCQISWNSTLSNLIFFIQFSSSND